MLHWRIVLHHAGGGSHWVHGAPWGECEFSLFTGSVRKTGTHICYESIFIQYIRIYSMFVFVWIYMYIYSYLYYLSIYYLCALVFQLMVNWWFGLVVWICGIPENERASYLVIPLESQTTNPNRQLTFTLRIIGPSNGRRALNLYRSGCFGPQTSQAFEGSGYLARWWFQRFLIFTPNPGEDEPMLTIQYFSKWLVQPPTS